MHTPRALLLAGLCVSATVAPAISGCGSDEGGTGPSSPLHASWNATSFVGQNTDLIANGMTVVMTLAPAGTYTFEFTNDLIGACTPGPDCTETGAYSYTSTLLTIDPGTPDETVFSYSIMGTTLTLTGTIEAIPVTITFEKV